MWMKKKKDNMEGYPKRGIRFLVSMVDPNFSFAVLEVAYRM